VRGVLKVTEVRAEGRSGPLQAKMWRPQIKSNTYRGDGRNLGEVPSAHVAQVQVQVHSSKNHPLQCHFFCLLSCFLGGLSSWLFTQDELGRVHESPPTPHEGPHRVCLLLVSSFSAPPTRLPPESLDEPFPRRVDAFSEICCSRGKRRSVVVLKPVYQERSVV